MNCDSILFITKAINEGKIGGREQLCRLNERALRSIFGKRFFKYESPKSDDSAIVKILGAARGRVDGVKKNVLAEISVLIQQENIQRVFIDGSNLGSIAKYLKQRFSNLEIITFYHNVETRFFIGSLKRTKSLKSLAVLFGNYLAEKKATRFSDKIICLNERDSEVLYEFFGRRATHISQLTLEKPKRVSINVGSQLPSDEFMLFVGGNFYANLAGIEWFRDKVSPHVDLPLFVVGRGFEVEKSNLEISGKIIVVGTVNSLEDWYSRAKFVVAPIFDGSGMKTKVAEALMFGKKIVGTPEAFTGYENALPAAGWCCSSPEDFIKACSSAARAALPQADDALVELFESNYSFSAAKRRFSNIFLHN